MAKDVGNWVCMSKKDYYGLKAKASATVSVNYLMLRGFVVTLKKVGSYWLVKNVYNP